jgi:hypothetical protein
VIPRLPQVTTRELVRFSTATPCPSVAVVMLHWGLEEVTKRCLQSLGRIAYPIASVILIDNTDTLSPSVTG